MRILRMNQEQAEAYYAKKNIDHLLGNIYLNGSLNLAKGCLTLKDEVITLRNTTDVIVRSYGPDTWAMEVKVSKTDIIVGMSIVEQSELEECMFTVSQIDDKRTLQLIKNRQYFEADSYSEHDLKMKARTGTEHTDNIYNANALTFMFYPIASFRHSLEANPHLLKDEGNMKPVLDMYKYTPQRAYAV